MNDLSKNKALTTADLAGAGPVPEIKGAPGPPARRESSKSPGSRNPPAVPWLKLRPSSQPRRRSVFARTGARFRQDLWMSRASPWRRPTSSWPGSSSGWRRAFRRREAGSRVSGTKARTSRPRTCGSPRSATALSSIVSSRSETRPQSGSDRIRTKLPLVRRRRFWPPLSGVSRSHGQKKWAPLGGPLN